MPVSFNKIRNWIVSDETLNPFSVDFDRKKMAGYLSAYKKFEPKAEALVKFMLAANEIYSSAVRNISKTLSTLGSSKDDIITLLFKYLNAEEFRSAKAFTEKLKSIETIPDPETLHYMVYHGAKDERIGIATSQQFLVDATAEILRHIPASFNPDADIPDLQSSINRLWMMGNVICNLRDTCFSLVMNDGAYFEWMSETEVRIVRELPDIEKIRTASEIRNSNKLMEITTYLKPLYEKDKQVKKKLGIKRIKDGQVEIEVISNDKIEQHLHNQATLLKYHTQLANLTLDYFDGLTVSRVLDMITLTLELFDEFKLTYPDIDKYIDNPPAFIDRLSLIDLLAECMEIKKETVDKFVDGFSCDPSFPYFWRDPFYRYEDKLYFPLHAVTVPNVHLFIDKLMVLEGISYERLLSMFRDFTFFEFRPPHPASYEFSVFVPELLIDGENIFRSNLCFISRDTVLLAELFIYPYPIEFSEHGYVFNSLSHFTEVAKEKIKQLKQHFRERTEGKEILVAVVTDYPMNSGMVLNDVPVLDIGLLQNYYITGGISKMTKPLQLGTKTSTEFAKLRYYRDEDGFNKGIKEFIMSPPPVAQLLRNMQVNPTVITQPFLPLQVTIDIVNHIGELNVLKERIGDLNELMTYEYYVEPKKPDSLHEKIQYELSIVLHKMAFASYTPYEERWRIINAADKTGIVGNVHLLYYLTQVSSSLPGKILKPGIDFETVPVTLEAQKLYDRFEEHITGELSFLDFEMPDIFTGAEEKLLISSAIAIIDQSAFRKIDDAEINFLLINLLVLSGFQKKYDVSHYFHTGAMNMIDMLNLSHHYQKARDLSEELLLVSIKENKPWFGWYILFTCYSAQNNLKEAALYGSLFFSTIRYADSIDYKVLVNGGFALMKFFRNFGYNEFAIAAYNSFKDMDLAPSDKLKLAQVYYSVLVKEFRSDPRKLDDLYEYIDTSFSDIIKYGTLTVIPWLGLLYNLKRYRELGAYETSRPIDEYITKLEAHADPQTLEEIKSKVFGNGDKSGFINDLLLVFETRDPIDIVHELSNITLLAHNLIRESVKNADTEGILLAAIALSDLSYVYRGNPIDEERAPLIKEKNTGLENKLRNYQSHFLSSVSLRPGQVFVWLFFYEDQYGYILVDEKKKISIKLLSHWMGDELITWTRNISKFYFNSSSIKTIDYDLSRQEKDYADCLKFFLPASITLPVDTKELLICRSLDMQDIPNNLFVSNNEFAAAKLPVCNTLSPEYFSAHNNEQLLPADYSIRAWIPTDDNNFTVQMGFSLLEPILNEYEAHIETSKYPEQPPEGDINVFLAHGIRKLGGFKTVRTSDDPTTSILSPSKVFGKGSIAVLFICNSGSVAEDLYAMQVTSFATHLLKTDYSAVVASYWPFDVTMSQRWLKSFLKSIDAGDYVSQAVFNANKKLAEYDESTSTLYLAPAGQFAMHLYGNPNIRIALPSSNS